MYNNEKYITCWPKYFISIQFQCRAQLINVWTKKSDFGPK
jgi:hypothetical protein